MKSWPDMREIRREPSKGTFSGTRIVDGATHRNAFVALMGVGLSADRCTYSSADESKTRFERMAAQGNKPLYGNVDLKVSFLRSRTYRNEESGEISRAIGVYDTGIAENPAHAEAFMLLKISNTKPLKSIQQDLLERYKDRVVRY
jgi:hypothetical protein